MNRLLILTVFIFFFLNSFCNTNIDSLLSELDNTIENKKEYFNKKNQRIYELSSKLKQPKTKLNPVLQFYVYQNLFNEYESFIYDSAFLYAEKTLKTAYILNDRNKIAIAKTKIGFVLLSSGLFKEALDSLNTIQLNHVSDSIIAEYYSVIARTFYDLADYSRDNYFSEIYRKKGNIYMDSAIHYIEKNSSAYWSLESLKRMKSDDSKSAIEAFEYLIANYNISYHQYAIAASSLGYLYTLNNNEQQAIEMLIKAAIADIKSSTKETVALRNLSDWLYKKGDIKTSYKYIKLALDDATFYNARHRKIEIATILPIIEGEKLNSVEKQKTILVTYSAIITLLSFLVIVFAIIIFRQLKKLNRAKQLIQNTNHDLIATNSKLIEANKIKEEYIGHFFTINSEYIDKIEKFQKEVNRKITVGHLDDIKNVFSKIDLKKEREDFFHDFDKIFLKLFPDFINEFNALFKEEDRIILKDSELLNTDLRIFALIRLGINDNERIAKILEYSVNTIYTYKTKIKNKSIVQNDEFEIRVMDIKSI